MQHICDVLRNVSSEWIFYILAGTKLLGELCLRQTALCLALEKRLPILFDCISFTKSVSSTAILSENQFSMPVGRIEFMFLGPLSYEEYLMASSEDKLLDYINSLTLNSLLPDSIHKKCLTYLRNYFIVGGMPEAIDLWVKQKDIFPIYLISMGCHKQINNLRTSEPLNFEPLNPILRLGTEPFVQKFIQLPMNIYEVWNCA